MDHPSNQWSYFNRIYPNFNDRNYERTVKRKISLLPSTSVPCSYPNYRPLDNKQRRNYYSYFNDVYDSKVGSKRGCPQATMDRAPSENVSSKKRKAYHDKRFNNQRDARFVKATAARLIKRLNDPHLITIPENELLMKKRIMEKTKELLQLIEFRQSYHKHLVEFKRLVRRLTKWIPLIMKYTEHNRSELSILDSDKTNTRDISENILGDDSDFDQTESTTEIKSFKYWIEKTHRSKKRSKMKRNVLTKGINVQCSSVLSTVEKWPLGKKCSIHKVTKSIQWLGMSDKCTQLYCKRKPSKKQYHQMTNIQLQTTTRKDFVDDEKHFDSLNQTTSTSIMPPECNLPTISVANCIPLLYKPPKDPFVYSSSVKNALKIQNTELGPFESEREWTSQEDEAFKGPKVTISLKQKSPSLIVEYPFDEFCGNSKKTSKESTENKVAEADFPHTLSSSTSCQSTVNQEKRKQKMNSLAIKNIFTTNLFDGNSTDNETVYCGFEIEELCKSRSCTTTNTISENDSQVNFKKVTKFSRLPKTQTTAEPCEVKFKFNRNICTFSVNYNPSKILSKAENAIDQNQIIEGGPEFSEIEKIVTTPPKEFREITNNLMILQPQSFEELEVNETERILTQNVQPKRFEEVANNMTLQLKSLEELEISETDTIITIRQSSSPKDFGEVTNNLMLQSRSLINSTLLDTTSQKCDDVDNLPTIRSASLSVNDLLKTTKTSDEVTGKSDLLSMSEQANKTKSKRKWKYKVISDAAKHKKRYSKTKKKRTKIKKSQLENNKSHKVIKKPVSGTEASDVPKTETNNTANEKIVSPKSEEGDTQCSLEEKKPDDTPNVPETKNNESIVKRDIIEASETIQKILNVISANIVDLNPTTNDLVENKTFDGTNSPNNTTSTQAEAVDVADDIDNSKELEPINKCASANKVSSSEGESKQNFADNQEKKVDQENKEEQTPSGNSKSTKKITEPKMKGIYSTKKVLEKKLDNTSSNSELSKTTCISRIPKWRSMTVPPDSKRNIEAVNKNVREKVRSKTVPGLKTLKAIDLPEATVKSFENKKDVTESPNTVKSLKFVEVNNEAKNQNVIKPKVIKVNKINPQKRLSVPEEDAIAKRPRTSNQEGRFPSPALTKPTVSSTNKQFINKNVRNNEGKLHTKSFRNKLKGPVKILSFTRKTLASKKNNLVEKEKAAELPSLHEITCKFQAEPYKNINYSRKMVKFQSEDVFQQFRSVLCAKRSLKQNVLRKAADAQKAREATPIKRNKKSTKSVTPKKPSSSKGDETNEVNNSQDQSPEINSDNPKVFADSATQSTDLIKRKVKRLRQPPSKYYLSRYPLWYTLKRRWAKEKKRKSKNKITNTTPKRSSHSNVQTNKCQKNILGSSQVKEKSCNVNLNILKNIQPIGDDSDCMSICKSREESETHETNKGFENVGSVLRSDDKKASDATHETENGRKLKQNEVNSENRQLTKALEELKRYIESAIAKGLEEKQRNRTNLLYKNEEQVLTINSEEMFKNALTTLQNSEKKHLDERSSNIDGNTTSLSSFTKTQSQSLETLSLSESHKSLSNINKDNDFKLSFSSRKVREFIKKSCKTVSRIPVPLNTRRSNSEQNLRPICQKSNTKVSSCSTHSISTISAKHHTSMMCCNQLDTCSIFLFEVARHSREWSKWVRQIFSGINKFTSFIKEIKDDDLKTEEFYLKEWREFTSMVDKMLASWREYSKEVKKVTEHAIRKFKRIDNQCCPKCIEDGIISDKTMMREVAKKLIDAISTAELWRTWLDDIMKQASLLVDIQLNDKHQQNVVDYSRHTYDDMVQTFSQIAFCIGEASKVIQNIDLSELNK